ncbi:LHFPL tetraspan subfamily member 3 protein-like [Mixophyes fleayi]|uniref:LHFPL tetraspan subfamily member 3 protein-like n=1 Tax=Mixophyes fleayi TaxID=3061075 RepID=UPI003F4E04DD
MSDALIPGRTIRVTLMDPPEHFRLYETDFVQNVRAVAVLWASCTMFLGILDIVVLLQPAWVLGGEGSGQFGLYQVCEESDWGTECRGPPGTLEALPPFQTAAGFMLVALLLVLLSLACLGLLWFYHSGMVCKLCAWLQLTAASCQALACLLFPDGWDSPTVRHMCSQRSDRYQLGTCSVYWGFILAILGTADCLVLSILGFTLGKREDTLNPSDVKKVKKGFSSVVP